VSLRYLMGVLEIFDSSSSKYSIGVLEIFDLVLEYFIVVLEIFDRWLGDI